MLYLKFVIVSYRDKGLINHCVTFSQKTITNCVHHIKQNVKTHFGRKAAELVFPIATAFSTIQAEKIVEQLKQISPNGYEYLENIAMEHWCNTQWMKTWKFPPEARLPPRYGVVTSNTSECINSMIDDCRSEGWTDLLEGVLWKMAEKISENRQWYQIVDEDDVVSKVKQVLKECFCAAAAMQVVELEVGQKYMVTETYSATINLNQQQVPQTTQMEHQQSNMPMPSAPPSVKSNVLTIPEKLALAGGGRNSSILAGLLWNTLGNGKICHFQLFLINMCMIITRTKACNKFMNTMFSQLCRIR